MRIVPCGRSLTQRLMARYKDHGRRALGRPTARREPNESEQVILGACEHILETVPLHDVTVDLIADAAEVSRSTFYKYFPSKYSVIIALLGSVTDEIDRAVFSCLGPRTDVPPQVALREAFTAWTGVWAEHRTLLRAVSENWHSVPELDEQWNYLWERAIDVTSELLDYARGTGEAPLGPPSRQVAGVLVWSAERALHVAGLGDNPDMPSEGAIIESFVTVWYNALYNPPLLGAPTVEST